MRIGAAFPAAAVDRRRAARIRRMQDRDQQQKQIKLTMVHLDREEAEAKENQLRYEKMLKSLGFLGGLLIVILML